MATEVRSAWDNFQPYWHAFARLMARAEGELDSINLARLKSRVAMIARDDCSCRDTWPQLIDAVAEMPEEAFTSKAESR